MTFRPSPFCFTPLRELPFLTRGRPYYVKAIFEGRTGMMFVLADLPGFSWPAALFAPCNDAALDSLRECLTWIEPNFRAREEASLAWEEKHGATAMRPVPPLAYKKFLKKDQ